MAVAVAVLGRWVPTRCGELAGEPLAELVEPDAVHARGAAGGVGREDARPASPFSFRAKMLAPIMSSLLLIGVP